MKPAPYDKDVIKELFYCYFKPVTAKYLRLNIQKIGNTTESSYYGIRIAELEIYHVSPVEFYRLDKQLALSKAAVEEANKDRATYFEETLTKLTKND